MALAATYSDDDPAGVEVILVRLETNRTKSRSGPTNG